MTMQVCGVPLVLETLRHTDTAGFPIATRVDRTHPRAAWANAFHRMAEERDDGLLHAPTVTKWMIRNGSGSAAV